MQVGHVYQRPGVAFKRRIRSKGRCAAAVGPVAVADEAALLELPLPAQLHARVIDLERDLRAADLRLEAADGLEDPLLRPEGGGQVRVVVRIEGTPDLDGHPVQRSPHGSEVDLGHRLVNRVELADVTVLNTCAVTSEASRKSRQAARRLQRLNPSARLVLSGCYATLEPDQAAETLGVDLVVGNLGQPNLLYLNNGTADPWPLGAAG